MSLLAGNSLWVADPLPVEHSNGNGSIPPYQHGHVHVFVLHEILFLLLQKIQLQKKTLIMILCIPMTNNNLPTHKLLLNSTLFSLTAICCASKIVSRTETAPFFSTKFSCRSASSTVRPRTMLAIYHIFHGLYLMFAIWWHTNWNMNRDDQIGQVWVGVYLTAGLGVSSGVCGGNIVLL